MEKYFEIVDMIKKENLDATKLYLLECVHYQEIFNKETEIEVMNYCYDLWLDADADLCLGRLADIVVENWAKIQNDELLDTDIIDMCLNY